jgi:hypothetical protein
MSQLSKQVGAPPKREKQKRQESRLDSLWSCLLGVCIEFRPFSCAVFYTFAMRDLAANAKRNDKQEKQKNLLGFSYTGMSIGELAV